MTEEDQSAYIKRTENLVRPDEVSIISLFGSILGAAPVGAQKKLLASTSKSNPHMGFVVEPYGLFTCHEIVDVERAQALIPSKFRIVPTRIFADDEPRPYVLFGAFTVHTSAFWGSRIEMYVIAEDQETGLLSWVIVDYDTNTLSFDPGQGFVAPTAHSSTVTTTHRGTVVVDMAAAEPARRMAVEADLRQGVETPLDQTLWLEGNLSVAYGGELDDGSGTTFGLLFEPEEMVQALRIPLDAVEVTELSWHPGLFEAKPSVVACFPYAQHFITSQVPTGANLKSAEELREAVEDFKALPPSKGFSSAAIKRSILIGATISFLTTTSLLVTLILHFVLKH